MSAERYPTKEKAEIEIYGKSGNIIARIKDISQTGACLQLLEHEASALNKGDLVCMKVILRALKKEHRVNAQVVWSEGRQSGIQFLTSDQLVEKMMIRSA
jgi:hypothetical protein